MDIIDFIKANNLQSRKINYTYVNGNKKPIGEHKDWSVEKIKQNGGSWHDDKINAYSIYLKHTPDLYCIDFDEKDVSKSKLYQVLKITKCYYTETKKGWHYYCKIEGIDEYKNQQKIGVEDLEVDLLRCNNTWEVKDRKVLGENLKTFSWDSIKKFFDVDKMNFVKSTPTLQEIDPVMDDLQFSVPKCSKVELKNLLNKLSEKRYEYKYWLDVGIVCFNNFDGEEEGLTIWNEWSKRHSSYESFKTLNQKYFGFNEERDCKLSYKRIQKWLIEENSCNRFEIAYTSNGDDGVTNLMNEELVFYEGEYICMFRDGYKRLKERAILSHYKQYTFKIEVENHTVKMNPFTIWLENIKRRNVEKIVFNPRDNSPSHHFNLWDGFDIPPTKDTIDMTKLEPILKLIREVWADGNEMTYEYMLNWFAHILQKPWKKTGVCLALQSPQGVGKTIVINIIGKIIGDKYYYTASSLKHILGDFNGDCEGKLLVNLNECTWGGNKSQEGAFKEFITDDSVVINRKGLNTYRVENYANTIITTNAEWMVAVSRDDRRYNIQRCRDITPEERLETYTREFYQSVAKTDLQTFANFLFNRDIDGFDPRVYTKSDLHKDQVEKNLCSVETFYIMLLSGETEGNPFYDKPVGELNDEEMAEHLKQRDHESKRELYDIYVRTMEKVKHMDIVALNHFFRKLYKTSNGGIERSRYQGHPTYKRTSLEDARKLYDPVRVW